jgi:hypothetical protein
MVSGIAARKNISNSTGRTFDATAQSLLKSTSTFWVSFLLKRDSGDWSFSAFGLSLFNAGGEKTYMGDPGSTTSNFGADISGAPSWNSGLAGGTNTGLFVAKLNMQTGTANYWINPDIGNETPINAAATSGNISFTAWDTTKVLMSLWPNTNPNGYIDEIRLGTTFSDVTPVVPEPATYTMILGGLGTLLLLRRRLS